MIQKELLRTGGVVKREFVRPARPPPGPVGPRKDRVSDAVAGRHEDLTVRWQARCPSADYSHLVRGTLSTSAGGSNNPPLTVRSEDLDPSVPYVAEIFVLVELELLGVFFEIGGGSFVSL